MEENEFNIFEETPEAAPQEPDSRGWTKYALILILAGFCVPVMGLIYDNVPKILIAAAVIVLLVLIIKAVCERDKGIAVMRASDPERVETCSDIKSLKFDLSGGTFVINQGINFSINGTDEKSFRSYVKNGVWNLESVKKTRKLNPQADAYPVTISLPQNFNAEKASVNLTGARLLIYGISAYGMSLNNDSGDADIRNMYAQKLEMRCSEGNIRANAMTNGDISVICSKGKLGLNLGCYADSMNYSARAKNGRITIAGRTINSDSLFVDNKAAKKLNVTCENGETVVKFRQEAAEND